MITVASCDSGVDNSGGGGAGGGDNSADNIYELKIK